jgi:tetratricopeptide (TPR) repeat protein
VGGFQSAVDYLRRSLTIKEKVLGAEHPDVVPTLVWLATAIHRQNKRENFETAVGYLNRALAIGEKKQGPESVDVAQPLAVLGELECSRKQSKGLAHLQRALDIREKKLPVGSPLIAITLKEIGEAYLNLRQPLKATPRLEQASKLLESSQRDPSELAQTRFLLARALWDTNSDRERAITLAQQARTVFLKAGKRNREDLRQVEAWLSSRLKPQAALSL